MRIRFKKLVPSPAMAVALLALFVAMGGSAYAGVKLSKNSVTTKAIKNGAVTGKKIKKGTITAANIAPGAITGAQVNGASLTGVNALTLAGKSPDAFIPSSSFVHFNVAMNRGDAPKVLATFGPFTLTGKCSTNGATNFDAQLTVTSSNATSYYWSTLLTQAVPVDVINYTNLSPTAPDYDSNSPMFHDSTSGLTSFDADGEQLGALVGYPDANCRFLGSFFID